MVDDTPADTPEGRALETAIARDIHAGVLPPGSWLKQIALQQRYGRSRGDVRRALDKLVAQRLVHQVHNAGYRVRAVEDDWLVEVRQLRVILEGAAAELTVGRAAPEDIARLRGLAEAFSTALREGSILQQSETNLAFHLGLLALCPNRELARVIAETRLRMPAAPLSQWHMEGWMEESDRQHHAMVDALEAENGPLYAALVRGHIRTPARSPNPAPVRRAKVVAASSPAD